MMADATGKRADVGRSGDSVPAVPRHRGDWPSRTRHPIKAAESYRSRLAPSVRTLAALLSAVTYSSLLFAVRPLFGPEEYFIDEQFHVPQAIRYCRARFTEWDPKITTLPGLYLLSAAILVPSMKIYSAILSLLGILHNDDLCSLVSLRAINAIGAPACLFYAYDRCLLQMPQIQQMPPYTKCSYLVLAMSIATFPVIYAPYSMLYYTDAWATASVFLWYSYHLSKTNIWLKIILGGFCVLFRQTNIAWLVFACIIDVCYSAEKCFPVVKKKKSTFSYIQALIFELYDCCTIKERKKFQKLKEFLKNCWNSTKPNITVIGLFVLFVIFNNGDIVVGDRQAHIPCFHPMQLCYFMIFVLAFSLPWLISQEYWKREVKELSKSKFNIWVLVVLLILVTGLVYFNTIAHPYLLADNRHYTFYAWRLLFGPGKPVFLRYTIVPVYVYGLYLVDSMLMRSSVSYKLAFWIVTPLILCSQFLLEPRYFVVPYLMFRLHTFHGNPNNKPLTVAFIEFISYQVCNIVIMWIFLYRPFTSTMDKTGRLDRFTW